MLKTRLQTLLRDYPRQYWLLMAGMLINTIGMGFIWPFLNIYLKEKMGVAVQTATLFLLFEQIVSLFTTLGAGSVADRFGRKGLMVVSLGAVGAVFAMMGFATSGWMFAILMGLRGFFLPLYRVAADTMVGDLITDEERRLPAYSLLRTTNNVGVAIGPVLGGMVAAISYRASFLTAAAGMVFFAVFVQLLMRETISPRPAGASAGLPEGVRSASGYRQVLRDTLFLLAVLAFMFNGMGAGLPFQLIGVYGKGDFHLDESQVGLIMMVNAMMVVLFQVVVSNLTRKYNRLLVLAGGTLFYAAGITSIAFGSHTLHFGLSMAVMTIGELLIAPTFTSLAVNLAPPEVRARYMSVYWMGWSIGRGIGPALAGRMYDTVSHTSVWWMGGAFNLVACAIFLSLLPMFQRRMEKRN